MRMYFTFLNFFILHSSYFSFFPFQVVRGWKFSPYKWFFSEISYVHFWVNSTNKKKKLWRKVSLPKQGQMFKQLKARCEPS